MKKSTISPTFVMICIVSLVAAYGIGFCVNEIKANAAKKAQNKQLSMDIKQIKASNSAYETQQKGLNYLTNNRNNQFFTNRNTQTATDRNTQNLEGQDSQQARQSNGNLRNQGTNNRTNSNPSTMGMQTQRIPGNLGLANNQSAPGTVEPIQEPK